MARKSNADGCLGVLAIGAAVVFSLLPLFILVGALGGAVAMLVMWVVSWWRVRGLPKAPGANAFVMLPSEELAVMDAKRQEAACEAALEELRRRGAHLSRKKDGTYNEVSKLGKELNPLVRAKSRELSSVRRSGVQQGDPNTPIRLVNPLVILYQSRSGATPLAVQSRLTLFVDLVHQFPHDHARCLEERSG